MKWVVGIVLALVAALGALTAVGYYVLPPTTMVARAIDVERPPSLIYPLVSNLRTFNEFSPWYDRDPKAEYRFDGPAAGEGQRAAWISSVKELGSGTQTIVKTKTDEMVETELDFGSKGKARARFTLKPADKAGTRVTWTFISPCGETVFSVPCRYMNLITQPKIARDFDAGLQRLKKIAEELPAVDIASLRPELVSVAEREFAFVEGETPQTPTAIAAAMRQSFGYVEVFFTQNDLIAAGPPMAVTTKWAEGKFGFRAGVPFAGPAPAVAVGVKVGRTPAGQALRVIHEGTWESKRAVYAQLEAFIAAHRLKRAGDPWEVFVRPAPAPAPVAAAAAAAEALPVLAISAPGAEAATPVLPPAPPAEQTEIYYPVE